MADSSWEVMHGPAKCGVEIPQSAGVEIVLLGFQIIYDNNIIIIVLAPPPIISGSPRNTRFFQGLDLILSCSIILGDVVDTPVTVRGIWNRNGTQLMNRDENGRIIVVNPPVSSPPYNITLRFNPLNVTDAATYKCDMTVAPQNTTFISPATRSNSHTISVSGMMNQ